MQVLDKILHYTKRLSLNNPFFMFLGNFSFAVSHLKIHPIVHLHALKALTSLQPKRKDY